MTETTCSMIDAVLAAIPAIILATAALIRALKAERRADQVGRDLTAHRNVCQGPPPPQTACHFRPGLPGPPWGPPVEPPPPAGL